MSNNNQAFPTIATGTNNQIITYDVNGTASWQDLKATELNFNPETTNIGFRGKEIKFEGTDPTGLLHVIIGTINTVGWKAHKAYKESNIEISNDVIVQIAQILLETDNTLTDDERFEMEEIVLKKI